MFNKWFKLALVSFIGIIISGFALGLITSGSSGGTSQGHGGMSTNMLTNSHTTSGINASQAQLNMLMQRMNQMEVRMNSMFNGNYNNFMIPYSNNTGMTPSGSLQGNTSNSGGMPMM